MADKKRSASARAKTAKKRPAGRGLKPGKKTTRRAATASKSRTAIDRDAAEQLKLLYATGVAPPDVRHMHAALTATAESVEMRLTESPSSSGPVIQTVSAPPALAISQGAAPLDAPIEPVLDIHDIQGNSLVGFNKDFQSFLFFRITATAPAKQWLKQIGPRIATVAETLAWRQLFRAMRARMGDEPSGLVATWLNIAFTNTGIRLLRGDAELAQFTDGAFKLGMESRAGLLGDRVDSSPERKPVGWVVGSGEHYPDMLVIVASDMQESLNAEVDKILDEIERIQGASPRRKNDRGLHLVFRQDGADLGGGLKGHEHFGFKDGISQPGIRGRTADALEAFLTPRHLDPSEPMALTHARPGQPLIWPGQFVLGDNNPRQSDSNRVQPGPSIPAKPTWARNGSFLVFRRLQQDVHKFWLFMQEQAVWLSSLPGFANMTAIRLASLAVGRWPSGAPIIRAPLADDAAIAANDIAVNNFNFSDTTAPIKLRPDSNAPVDEFVPIPGDTEAIRCPFASHVRKVNPRDENTDDLGADERTLRRRLLRRGIPYGPPMRDPLRPTDDEVDRGLLFVSYQSSIVEQFEFLQSQWTNSSRNPKSYNIGDEIRHAGHDLIMGQTSANARGRTFTVRGDSDAIETLALPSEFVTTTGGGYFFAPSISALLNELSA